ncbi:hypothetical protein A3J56_01810 [Candidatus Giovannonibacteria bacterium RIFCSPHIGHO2_02_FULL_46_20]|uniref:Methyltransferase type 11 domain-containing protein n=1 Tax=Candidatus Giovannonibacteria bacterium RIFCSPHIGHO2_02_FULL_46_20 TaxID=1798338 RepID=A0A1F5WEL0_9BACT|nr:MAG: hypothetical protein A3J56_01810 [Candidatus Giovannonibacteria bacterium RIFCSPHIGHO2_02_FULL_46_20]
MLFRCAQCGFIFADTARIDLNAYYNNEYLHKCGDGFGSYVNYEFDKMPMEPTYRNVLNTITLVRSGKRLLDAGAANGYFIGIANSCGYEAEGFDINLSAAEEAAQRGRKVKHGDLFTCHYAPGSFDVITAFDFFEHLPHEKIEQSIQAMQALLLPQGILAIITVNTASIWARMLGKYWHSLLPPEHISFFNKKNMRLCLERNRFDVLETRTIHKKFSLQYLFNILYKWQKLLLWRRATSFLEQHPKLGRFSFTLYIGDNMFVLAKNASRKEMK